MDAPPAAGDLVRLAGLGNPALDGVGHQLLVALAPGPAVIDLADNPAFVVKAVRVDGAENVPAPPPAAQCPAVAPLEIATPLPPSTIGSTSTPPIRMVSINLMPDISVRLRGFLSQWDT